MGHGNTGVAGLNGSERVLCSRQFDLTAWDHRCGKTPKRATKRTPTSTCSPCGTFLCFWHPTLELELTWHGSVFQPRSQGSPAGREYLIEPKPNIAALLTVAVSRDFFLKSHSPKKTLEVWTGVKQKLSNCMLARMNFGVILSPHSTRDAGCERQVA